MKHVVTAEQAKEIDRFTIEEVGIPSMVLMERAALAVAEKIVSCVKVLDRILCICGRGNNGGDGIAVARMLHQKGYAVFVHLIGNPEKATKDNLKQVEIAKKIGVSFVNNLQVEEYNVIVDAIFGIGLSRNVTGIYQEVIQRINGHRGIVFSVDIPSGIHSDTGQVMGCAVQADVTVAFGYAKQGELFYPGAEYAGELVVSQIGFVNPFGENCSMLSYEKKDIQQWMPKRQAYANKGTYGKVLVIAGCKNMAGACYLSAAAAYAMGAGLVKIITPEINREIIQTLLPEAVLHTYEEECGEKQKDEWMRDIREAKAIVIGPGLGRGLCAKKILELVMKYAIVPVVLDADALQILADDSTWIEAFRGEKVKWKLRENMILTPHLKEMTALLGDDVSVADLQTQKLDVREICKDNANVLVLKDARTLVIQGEKCYINLSGNSGMATAGSGDVLTGIILGLLAQQVSPYIAASLGVYIHGLAGDVAARRQGAYSMTARDIVNAIPEILRACEGGKK